MASHGVLMKYFHFTLIAFLFLAFVQPSFALVNGLVSINVPTITEDSNLDVYVKCKDATTDTVTVTLYNWKDEELAHVSMPCNIGAATFTNVTAGIYKVEATMSATSDPSMLFVYTHVKPSFKFLVPESPFIVPALALFILFTLCFHRYKQH